MLMLPALSHLLAYQNDTVVQQFIRKQPGMTLAQGRQAFSDLLAWMWLSVARQQNHLKTHMFGPLLLLDELWHTFILHTREYTQFCDNYFHNYFHHEVEPLDQEAELTEEHLSEFLEDCYERLGREWVLRNFQSLL